MIWPTKITRLAIARRRRGNGRTPRCDVVDRSDLGGSDAMRDDLAPRELGIGDVTIDDRVEDQRHNQP